MTEPRVHAAGKPLIILGAGGHAKVLAGMLLELGADIIGVIDPKLQAGANSPFFELEALGDDAQALKHHAGQVLLVNGVGSLPGSHSRRDLFDRFKLHGYTFATVVDPSALLAREVSLGEGAQIMAGTVIQTGTAIGANCIVNTRASIDHDCRVGEQVHVAPGAVLSGGVVLESGVHVGPGAVIGQGVFIAAGSIIGAGASVVKDIRRARVVYPAPHRNAELKT